MTSQISASAQKSLRTPTSRTSLGSGFRSNGLLPPNVTDRAARRQTFIPNLRGHQGFTLPRSPPLTRSEDLDPSSANDNQERQHPESIDDDGHEEDFTNTFQHPHADLFNGQGGIFVNPLTESKAPMLQNGSLKDWERFRPLLASYRHHNGIKSLGDLMSRSAQSVYTDIFHSTDLSRLSDEQLIDTINTHHYGQASTQPVCDTSSISMPDIPYYDKEQIQVYMTKFSELKSSERAGIGHLDPRALAVLFLKGINYAPFRKLCEDARPKSYYEALDTVTKVTAMFDTALIVLNCVDSCNGANKDLRPKSKSNVFSSTTKPSPTSTWNQKKPTAPRTSSSEGILAATAQTTPPVPPKSRHKCANCEKGHHGNDCTAACTLCASYIPQHPFRDCPHRNDHISNVIRMRRAATSAAALVTPPQPLSAASATDEQSVLNDIEQVSPPHLSRDILFDSGASARFIHNSSYFNGNLYPLSPPTRVTTATGASANLSKGGQFFGRPAIYAPSFKHTLLGVSSICNDDNICVFTKDHMYGVSMKHASIKSHIHALLDKAKLLNSIHYLGYQHHGIYRTSFSELKSLRDQSVSIDSGMQDRILIANASYYHTVQTSSLSELVQYWHEALGHPSMAVMIDMISSNTYTNLPKELTTKAIRKYFPLCAECPLGNLARSPLPQTCTPQNIVAGEQFQIDLEGPWLKSDSNDHLTTFSGCKYTLTAIDMKSRMPFGWLLKSRKHLIRYLEELRLAVSAMGRTLKVLRTDDEFITIEIRAWCLKEKITLLPCVPYEHAQIGVVERVHRTFRDAMVKCMANKPHLDTRLWGLCWLDVVFKYSTLPNSNLPHHASPYMLWFGKSVDVLAIPMVPFGSVVMGHIPLELQTKSGHRSTLTYCVGSATDYKGGLLLFNPVTHHTIIRRTFKVLGPQLPTLPLTSSQPLTTLDPTILLPQRDILTTSSHVPTFVETSTPDHYDIDTGASSSVPLSSVPPLPSTMSIDVPTPTPIMPLRKSVTFAPDTLSRVTPSISLFHHKTKTMFKSTLSKSQVIEQRNDEWYEEQSIPLISTPSPYQKHFTTFSSDRQNRALKRSLVGALVLGLALSASISSTISYVDKSVPKSYDIALLGPEAAHWKAAVQSEVNSLKSMGVWNDNEYIDPKSIDPKCILPSKLVLAKCWESTGKFKKFKARIVGRGDRYDIDLDVPTYAGTVSSESLRLLIALAAEHDLEMESVDVKTAFLYAELDESEVIYMRRPKGLTDFDMPPIVRLRKCIYGLPQAAEKFRTHSDKTLRRMGFKPLISDACVYVKHSGSDYAFIAVHVDDFAIISTTTTFIAEIKLQLSQTYEISVCHNLESFCGLHITRDRPNKIIDLLQTAYAESVCTKFDIDIPQDACPLTPMATAETYYASSNPDLVKLLTQTEITTYRSMIGCLLYLAKQTRADILFAVTFHARHSKVPTRRHNNGVLRILQYICGTKHLGLRFKSVDGIALVATVDASYASHPDLKSHTGCTLAIGKHSGSFISVTEKQSITADSSTVAEFIAGHTIAKKVLWARNFLHELGPLFSPMTISADYYL